MILSHQHKIIYIHIPRTGGSWLSYKLLHYENNYHGSGREMYSIEGKKLPFGRHTKLENIYNQSDTIGINPDTYFKFVVVRHPFTRFMSAWRYFTKYMMTAQRNNLHNTEDLMDWIENGSTKLHIQPQANWYDKRFDKIVRFEDIESFDLKDIIPNWQIKNDKIAKTVYNYELSVGVKKRIEKFYAKDFELFDY